MNFRNGHIYKIICSKSDVVYIGSTFNKVSNRWNQHKSSYRQGKYRTSLKPYLDKYGLDAFHCIKVKDYKVCDKKHLLVYEQLWISKTKCINKCNTIKPLYKKMYNRYYRSDPVKYRRELDLDNIRRRKRVTCDKCNKEMNKGSLGRHIKHVHNKAPRMSNRIVKCDKCNKEMKFRYLCNHQKYCT